MEIEVISPVAEEARSLICEFGSEIAALYPDYPIDGIVTDEFEKADGYFVVARDADRALGCGGLHPLDKRCVEIKRMFVREEARRRGVARRILRHLEEEARRRGFRSIVLETGCNNTAARALYEAEGYHPIPAFLGYVGIPISRCYEKNA